MDKEKYIQLTKDLYRLTVLFPKKDPLRYKMRELATNILAKPERKDVEALNSLFEVAKSQNWVTFSDLSTVQENYVILLKTLDEIKPEIKRQIATEIVSTKGLASRQEKILSLLKEKGKAQVWELKQVFPQTSKRTIRRDCECLLKEGMIERMGERNNTFYQVKSI
jgi:Fic family protein